MNEIGTANSGSQISIMLLGSGELGKEFTIAAQRLGIYVIAVDRYPNAPAMHVAHQAEVIDMQDHFQLKHLVEKWNPTYIVPEIEAISTRTLLELEINGYNVVPSAKAVHLTMDRQGIRDLAANELNLPTSKFKFVDNYQDYLEGVRTIGIPCVLKPTRSSSGKGQFYIKSSEDIETAWHYAHENSRGKSDTFIIEEFIQFDEEITLLTVKHQDGTSFCQPIGHTQKNGDYQESWQPHDLRGNVIKQAQYIAKTITDNLGGHGIFGVELFIKGNEVYFNEVSPRPHDTGLVTLASQNINQFELHLRAILGLPVPKNISIRTPAASAAILLVGNSNEPSFVGVSDALKVKNSDIKLFGKPFINGQRRMGVALVFDDKIDDAIQRANQCAKNIDLKH